MSDATLIQCPWCNLKMRATSVVKFCPGCGNPIKPIEPEEREWQSEPPPVLQAVEPPPPAELFESTGEVTFPASGAHYEDRSAIRSSVVAGMFGAIIGGFLGFLSAHWLPIYGGPLAIIAEPFSPLRWHLTPGHVAIFAIAGAVLVGVVHAIFSVSRGT